MKVSIKLTKRVDIDKNNILLRAEKVFIDDKYFYPRITNISFNNENNFNEDSLVFIRFKLHENTKTVDCGSIRNLTRDFKKDLFSDFLSIDTKFKFTFHIQDKDSNKIIGSNKGFAYVQFDDDGGDDDISSKAPIKRSPVSPISVARRDTGLQLWEIDTLSEDDQAVTLYFNEKMPIDISKDPFVRNLILPSVFERMIHFMVEQKLIYNQENRSTWPGKMNFMIKKFFDKSDLPDEESTLDDISTFSKLFTNALFMKQKDNIFNAAINRVEDIFNYDD